MKDDTQRSTQDTSGTVGESGNRVLQYGVDGEQRGLGYSGQHPKPNPNLYGEESNEYESRAGQGHYVGDTEHEIQWLISLGWYPTTDQLKRFKEVVENRAEPVPNKRGKYWDRSNRGPKPKILKGA